MKPYPWNKIHLSFAMALAMLLGCTALIVYDFLRYRKKKNK